MEELKKHPLWHEVVELIASHVSEKGYGGFYSHTELRDMLDIKKPKTIEEHEKAQFDYLNALDSLKNELLQEYNIYLENKKGDGYIAVHPDVQVTICSDKQLNKARNFLVKASQLLVCVEEQLLSSEASNLRLQKMKRVAFLRGAFRKRKFPAIEEKKMIGQ